MRPVVKSMQTLSARNMSALWGCTNVLPAGAASQPALAAHGRAFVYRHCPPQIPQLRVIRAWQAVPDGFRFVKERGAVATYCFLLASVL